MCGIAGAFGRADNSLLREMISCLDHRGPDETGKYIGDNVMLGNSRLSIIDLEGGTQPVSNEDGDIQVVCNGEIYNYQSKRRRLEEKGHNFSTDVDVEVIPHLYEEYGKQFVNQLNGMFAIALWDQSSETLFLYRDHVGIKPLYYMRYRGSTYFGSELKSLLRAGVPREPDPVGLSYYWHLDYIPAPHTAIKNVQKLEPGNCLEISTAGHNQWEYWNVMNQEIITGSNGRQQPEAFYTSRVRNRLEDAVERRLLADVPVGAFLSGGLDSTTVVALMSEFRNEPVNTFSIGFEDRAHDESSHSQFVADHFDTNHTEYTMSLDDASLVTDVLAGFDEPLADPASIPTALLAEKASQEVKVVNTGSGADELFAGYDRYPLDTHYWNRFQQIPNAVKHAARFASQFAPEKSKGERYLKYLGSTTSQTEAFIGTRLRESTTPLANSDSADLEPLVARAFDSENYLQNMMQFDIDTWLPGDLLVKVDRTTMQHGLEARTPFLDPRLVEFAMRIPPELKLKNGTQKYVLKKAVEDIVPSRIINREKDAFNIPVRDWLCNADSPLRSRFTPAALDPVEFLDTETVLDRYERLNDGNANYQRMLWKVLNLQVWHEMYIQGEVPQ